MSGVGRINPNSQLPLPSQHHDAGVLEHQRLPGQSAGDNRWGRLAQSLKNTGGQILSDSLSQLPSARSMGAVAGHVAQQLVTCGATTFAREEVFMHAYNAMLPVLGEKAKWGLLGAQGAISLATIGANLYREKRLDRLQDSSVNVRGHFGLSADEWSAKTPAEKTALTQQHRTDSHNVTRNQIAAEAAFLSMSLLSLAKGDGALAARVLATQLRNLTYAGSRESLQASIALTTSQEGRPTNGVNASNIAANGWTYTALTLAAGYLQDAAISHLLPEGQSVTGPALNDNHGQPLTGKELASAAALVAGIRGLANTMVEIGDAQRGKHYDLKQVGDQQKLQTDIKKMFPLKDYERLLDHSPARLSWNNVSNAAVLGAGELAKLATHGKLSQGASQLLSNGGTAALFGLTYRMVNQTYQAHGKNRAAWSAEQTQRPQQTEAGTGVPITAVPEDAENNSLYELKSLNSARRNEASDTMTDAGAGPGPSTQANRQARERQAFTPQRSSSTLPSMRSSLDQRSSMMSERINAQEPDRAAIRAGKQREVAPSDTRTMAETEVASAEPASRPVSPASAAPPERLSLSPSPGALNLEDDLDAIMNKYR